MTRQAPLWLWLSGALAGSVLVNPHAYVYDAAVLLVALWLILFRSEDRILRVIAVILVVPLPFLTLLAGPPWSALPALLLVALLFAMLRARRT